MSQADLLSVENKISKRAAVWTKVLALHAEIGDKPSTKAQRDEWNGYMAEADGLEDEIRALGGTTPQTGDTMTTATDDRYRTAFGNYLRHGTDKLDDSDRKLLAEHRAQAEGTNTAGGYLVPQGYREVITETLKAYGGLLSIANVITTATGNTLPWPSNDDTGNLGSLLSENTQVSEVDVTFGTKALNAWTYTSGSILASLQLIQDSAFDLDVWVPTMIGKRIGRAIANDFINGSGSYRPTGLLTNVRTGVTGAAGETSSIAYADLVNLVHSVDPAYRQAGNCKFLMNDVTMGSIRKITDTTGRPLWAPAFPGGFMGSGTDGPPDTGPVDTILGYPVQVDNAMPVMAAGAKSIVFGDFNAGYVIRQVLETQVLRLVERYADYLQVGFIGFARVDGVVDAAAALAAFVNAAA